MMSAAVEREKGYTEATGAKELQLSGIRPPSITVQGYKVGLLDYLIAHSL